MQARVICVPQLKYRLTTEILIAITFLAGYCVCLFISSWLALSPVLMFVLGLIGSATLHVMATFVV